VTLRKKEVLWIVVYILLIISPLLILVLAPRPAGRTFWRELSVALGFVGLSLMGLQFIPTARLHFVAEIFPLDTLYSFHHRISVVAFLLTLVHPLMLFVHNPYTLRLLNLFSAPWRARAGTVAMLALILLIITSVRRVALGIDYEAWHIWHDVFSLIIMGLALYHIFEVDYYTAVPLQRGLWVVMAVLWSGMLLYIRVIKPWMLLKRPYKVVDMVEERGNTWSLVLEPEGHEGLTFRAGQVAWLSIGHSPFHIEQHPFSFSSSAEDKERFAFAIKELGDFTDNIGDLALGTTVYVDGPYGTFDLFHHHGTSYVFIAGGIGSAPVMSMLRTLADRDFSHSLKFFYGNPTWDDVIFREELAELETRLDLEVIHVLENPPEDWDGEAGFITQEVLERHTSCEDRTCTYFICGPLPMIEAVENALEAMGASRQRMYSENYEMA
jgi:predicted ferric reductase